MTTAIPAPVYTSWEDYLARTTVSDRRKWCAKKADNANRKRLLSVAPDVRVATSDVLTILENARGRCAYCGSLAVENRPSKPNGAPLPWESIGRRIGSLGHRIDRFYGGGNECANLCWACLWCNTWPSERTPGATDYGAII